MSCFHPPPPILRLISIEFVEELYEKRTSSYGGRVVSFLGYKNVH
jgi:hypothetical protein